MLVIKVMTVAGKRGFLTCGNTTLSVIAGQTMVWAIFHLLSINLKFQWAILSKFNIAISVVNGPFFC